VAELNDEPQTAEADSKATLDQDKDLMQRLKAWERQARNHWSKWRDEAKQCYDFVAGHQWTAEDKTSLLDQMRQPVTFNRVAPMVDAVTGAEILNRQEVRYIPREQGDVQVNEIITAADEWARELADTEDEESDAFADVVICGLGWSETKMDYSIDPEGRIVDERIDPLEMWSIPTGAFQRNLGNARGHIRARYRDLDSLPAKWRKRIPTSTTGSSSVDDPTTGWTGPRDDYEREEGPDKDRDTNRKQVWIRHIQWWEEEPAWRINDPMTGQAATLSKKQLKQLAEMYLKVGMQMPEAVRIEQRKYYQAVLCGHVFLEPKTEIEANAFTFKAITGKRDRNTNTFFGAVRAMVDPQMWGNKFFVQIMHILNTSAKGGLMYEADVFANPRKALEDWAKPDAAIELKRGALSGPKPALQERTPAVFPAGTEKMMEFALNNLPQTSGINLELLGLVEREQPGVLEMQRKKAGYAILAVFFDSLRRYRKEKGRVRLFFIQNYISDGRLIRIKGQDSTMRYVPLVKQDGTATYDVIVDEAPMSPNQKEQTWAMLQAMMPLLAKLNVPPEIWATIIEHSPLPSSVSSKINQIISQKAQEPPPPDPEMLKIEAQVKGEQAKLQAKAQADERQAQIEQQKAELEAQMEIVTGQQKLEIERELAEIEKQKKIMEIQAMREKNQLQAQADWNKLQVEQQANEQRLAHDDAAAQQKLQHTKAMDDQAVQSAKAKADAAPKKEGGERKGRKITIKRDGGRISEIAES
jgi:hypothetical protein